MMFDDNNNIKFCIENMDEINNIEGLLNHDNGYSCNNSCFIEFKFKIIFETKECVVKN